MLVDNVCLRRQQVSVEIAIISDRGFPWIIDKLVTAGFIPVEAQEVDQPAILVEGKLSADPISPLR
jgi:hypothetical protein